MASPTLQLIREAVCTRLQVRSLFRCVYSSSVGQNTCPSHKQLLLEAKQNVHPSERGSRQRAQVGQEANHENTWNEKGLKETRERAEKCWTVFWYNGISGRRKATPIYCNEDSNKEIGNWCTVADTQEQACYIKVDRLIMLEQRIYITSLLWRQIIGQG